MPKFYLHRNGVLVQTGSCPDDHLQAQVRDGLTLGIGDPPSSITYPAPQPLTYDKMRLLAYPSIGDQLDAIWKGGAAMEAMRVQIEAVKSKFPKPTTP